MCVYIYSVYYMYIYIYIHTQTIYIYVYTIVLSHSVVSNFAAPWTVACQAPLSP